MTSLAPGMALRVRASACVELDVSGLRPAVESAAVIVRGRLAAGPDASTVLVAPDRYLKGAPDSRSFLLTRPAESECPPAALAAGSEAILILESVDGSLAWPDVSRTFVVEGGQAVNQVDPPSSIAEAELIRRIQSVTGQDAIPGLDDDDGPRIDWIGTVLPVSLALGVIFAIGLVMMRVWHRIDPT